MSEIEKEITRRSQNKNIKQMGLPYTPPPKTEPSVLPKETLNQLRSSFNLPESGPTTGPAVYGTQYQQQMMGQPQQQIQPQLAMSGSSMFPAGSVPMGGQMQMITPLGQPAAPPGIQQQFINPFGQSQQHQPFPLAANPGFAPTQQLNGGLSQPQFTPEQLVAAFTQQQQQLHQMAAASSSSPSPGSSAAPPPASTAAGAGVLAPPPAPSHPVHRNPSAGPSTANEASCSDWPEENKENGDEPVWVLRDSYLKRIQREAQQEEGWGEEAVTSLPVDSTTAEAEEEEETDRLIADGSTGGAHSAPGAGSKKKTSKETMVHEPAVLIEGVLFRARYLGSTQMMCETRGSKTARMGQAQEAVARVKAPEGEIQPSTEIDLFISTEKIMVLNTDLQRISDTDVRQDILMDHALRTISYIADIGDLVVLMARRMSASDSDDQCSHVEGVKRAPKVVCHVFESDEASFIAQSIGQAFQVAYVEFLRANGIDDPSYLRQIDYQEVLNSQELMGDELEMFARKETQKDVVVPKKNGEALGVVVVESGWGSMLPTVVLAHMNPAGPAARSNQLNIGDQIININGISLVGLPLSAAQNNIKNVKSATAVRLTVVSTPPVVEVRIRRPDTKYQLGFSVQNGVICSLLRGGIAERGGIRVGHRIIEINGHSVVAVAHDRIVNMLATAIGEIHMKTMPTSMYRLLTGQEIPQYI